NLQQNLTAKDKNYEKRSIINSIGDVDN
ncbi:MAG: hypothetical protein K0S84_1610, partial [Nitrososphaera sp.]|nr:hypothetical protein [Nitrososphaera sp.]